MEEKTLDKRAVVISTIAFSMLGILTIIGTKLNPNSILYYSLFGISIIFLIIGGISSFGYMNKKQLKFILYPSITIGILTLVYVLFLYFS